MHDLYIDESGYTGVELLDPEQPFQVLAGLMLSADEAIRLKSEFFSAVRAPELKFSLLARRPIHQERVLRFLAGVSAQSEAVMLSVSLKRYALVGKIVDTFVESAMHLDGLDAYERGYNIALTNMLFYTLPPICGKEFTDDLLVRFQRFMREPTRRTYKECYEKLFGFQFPDDWIKVLGPLQASLARLGPDGAIYHARGSLEYAWACAYILVGQFSSKSSEPFRVIHDASTSMSDRRFHWNAMMRPDVRPATVGYDRRKYTLPFKVSETIIGRSHEWAGLQLADVLAGAVNMVYRSQNCGRPLSAFEEKVACAIEQLYVLPLLPEPKFTPEELETTSENGEDLLEYMSESYGGYAEQLLREVDTRASLPPTEGHDLQ